jgi:hypothetical protein
MPSTGKDSRQGALGRVYYVVSWAMHMCCRADARRHRHAGAASVRSACDSALHGALPQASAALLVEITLAKTIR